MRIVKSLFKFVAIMALFGFTLSLGVLLGANFPNNVRARMGRPAMVEANDCEPKQLAPIMPATATPATPTQPSKAEAPTKKDLRICTGESGDPRVLRDDEECQGGKVVKKNSGRQQYCLPVGSDTPYRKDQNTRCPEGCPIVDGDDFVTVNGAQITVAVRMAQLASGAPAATESNQSEPPATPTPTPPAEAEKPEANNNEGFEIITLGKGDYMGKVGIRRGAKGASLNKWLCAVEARNKRSNEKFDLNHVSEGDEIWVPVQGSSLSDCPKGWGLKSVKKPDAEGGEETKATAAVKNALAGMPTSATVKAALEGDR